MLIKPVPIFVEDIVACSTTNLPVSVDCAAKRPADQPLGHGWLHDIDPQPGLCTYAADYNAYEDYAVREIERPMLRIEINLGAPQGGEMNAIPYELAPNSIRFCNTREPIKRLNRRGAGTRQWRCGIVIEQTWLAGGRLDELELSSFHARELLQSHANPWKADATSPTLLALANRMAEHVNCVGPLARLRCEAITIEFLAEGFALFGIDRDVSRVNASGVELRRIRLVREYLESLGPTDTVSLAGLARTAGMSVRSLSRHFRAVFGTSISAYVADIRMEKSRLGLARGQLTIASAAYIAGFAHIPNFTAAFRRRYGYTPGSLVAGSRPRGSRE